MQWAGSRDRAKGLLDLYDDLALLVLWTGGDRATAEAIIGMLDEEALRRVLPGTMTTEPR